MFYETIKYSLLGVFFSSYAWFIGVPTLSIIYDQGIILKSCVTNITVNKKLSSITITFMEKMEETLSEEAGVLEMIENPELRKQAEREYDIMEEEGLTVQEVCDQGWTDQKGSY